MKQKHVFICESDVYENMRVHVLWIGRTKSDQKIHDAILRAASLDKDVYFAVWNCEVCEFLRHLSEQVYPNLSPRQAFEKFNENNLTQSTLCDVLQIVKSLPTNTHVITPKYLNNEIKHFQRS